LATLRGRGVWNEERRRVEAIDPRERGFSANIVSDQSQLTRPSF